MPTNNVINWAPTQYNTIVGSTNGGITNVTPGSSGQLLTSNGVSSNPSYQAVPTLILSVVIQSFTSSGTYTPTTGMRWCEVEVMGGGGSGGVNVATDGTGGSSIGGAGGAGGYARGIFYNTSIGASQTVTIGAGGSASGGGTTSLGSLISATGGAIGATGGNSTAIAMTAAALGGTGTGGNIQINGGAGQLGIQVGPGAFQTNGTVLGAPGGSSAYGGASRGSVINGTTTSGTGTAANNYASGGSGARGLNIATIQAAGVGTAGLITITEWVFS